MRFAEKRKYKRISYGDRIIIENKLKNGERVCVIANYLDINRTHLYKEIKRGKVGDVYSAEIAESKLKK